MYESVPKTNTVSIMAAVTIIFFVVYQIFSQLLNVKCPKTVTNAHHNFPKSKVTSSNSLISPTNSPKPKDFMFMAEKGHKSSHLRRLKQQMFDVFAWDGLTAFCVFIFSKIFFTFTVWACISCFTSTVDPLIIFNTEAWTNYIITIFSLFRSLSVHPDMVTIATGQVAGNSKDGKVPRKQRFTFLPQSFTVLLTATYRHSSV